ncbi:MAG: XRE family transcriptional regulator [Planctomycetota bacterium]|nr:XRE family transcriptional regulator [Planctomycetota bacterium]
MSTLGAIIRARRREVALTLQQVADIIGCTRGYLSSIENDRRDNPPSRELLEKLEGALRLEPGTLVSVGDWALTPAHVKRRVLDLETRQHKARRLAHLLSLQGIDALHRSGELQRLVADIDAQGPPAPGATSARPAHADQPHAEQWGGWGGEPRGVRGVLPLQVPVINRVAAGYPTEFTDLGYPARIADEYVSVPDVHDPDAFAARVVGSSMEPAYLEGDVVVFSPKAPTPPGSDCFVRFERDAETTFKRVYFEKDAQGGPERIRLQPLNPAFAPRVVEREEVAGMYAAVCVVRAVRPLAPAAARRAENNP